MPPDPQSGFLGRLAHALTLAGGAILLAVAALVVASVAGRYFFNAPVVGDFELVEMGMAIAILLAFPYAHLSGTNLVAEFFTNAMGERGKLALDAVADAVFAVVAGAFTWRLTLGAWHKFEERDTTMLIQIPVWIGYALAVLAMAVLTMVCLVRLADEIGRLRR